MALESSPHAVMLESEGRVTHANQAFVKLMGASSIRDTVGSKVCAFCNGEGCKRGAPICHAGTGNYYEHKLVELHANGRDWYSM